MAGRHSPLAIGLVGAGIAGRAHADALARLSRGRLAAVYDPDATRSGALAARHGAEIAADIDALIAACDAVIIASPAAAHEHAALRALDAGRHALVEKPLATNPQAAEALVRLAQRRRVCLQCGHQDRLRAAALGLFEARSAPTELCFSRLIPAAQAHRDVSITFDVMIHDLDLTAALFGASPLSIAARATVGADGVADEVTARLGFAAGDVTLTACRRGAARSQSLRILYETGALAEVDLETGVGVGLEAAGLNPRFAAEAPDPLLDSLAQFVDAATGVRPCCAPGIAGAAAVRLAALIDAAAAQAQAGTQPLSAMTLSG